MVGTSFGRSPQEIPFRTYLQIASNHWTPMVRNSAQNGGSVSSTSKGHGSGLGKFLAHLALLHPETGGDSSDLAASGV